MTPRYDLLLPGEPVGYDGEFQNFKHVDDLKWSHRAGRSAFVNTDGEVVLDVYSAYPKEEGVRKMMPRIGGQDVFDPFQKSAQQVPLTFISPYENRVSTAITTELVNVELGQKSSDQAWRDAMDLSERQLKKKGLV